VLPRKSTGSGTHPTIAMTGVENSDVLFGEFTGVAVSVM
jgi:hypothetical protein